MMPLFIGRSQREDRHMPSLNDIVVRLHGPCLDAELAAGVPPELSARHAARARWLVAPRTRQVLADGWERLLVSARGTTGGLSNRTPIRRQRIRGAEPEIRELIRALRANGPMPARGIAVASKLLTDGRGPVYNNSAREDIKDTLALALAHLDASLPLTYGSFT
jgi:hypothetical protein